MLQFLSLLQFVIGSCPARTHERVTHTLPIRPQSSSFLGLPYLVLTMNHKKELLRGWLNPLRVIPKRNYFRAEYEPQKGTTKEPNISHKKDLLRGLGVQPFPCLFLA